MTIEELFKKITEENTEDNVYQEVDDAYKEQGRGEAENLTLRNLIHQNGGENMSVDDYSELFNQLAEHYNLNMQ